MQQDRFRKKTNKLNGSGSSLETTDIAEQVPETEDVLAEIDKALEKAEVITDLLRPRKQDRCGC